MTKDQFRLLDEVFYRRSSDGQVTATGKLEGLESFRVLAGSTAKGSPNWVVQEQLIQSGALVPQDKVFVFPRDYVFSTPSPAAEAVLGRKANGWKEWKTKGGKTLGEAVGRGK